MGNIFSKPNNKKPKVLEIYNPDNINKYWSKNAYKLSFVEGGSKPKPKRKRKTRRKKKPKTKRKTRRKKPNKSKRKTKRKIKKKTKKSKTRKKKK